jgi:methylase of polypeptide subunit release factors
MSAFQSGDGYTLRHLTDNYHWGDRNAGAAVDLGGSAGAIAFALTEKFPAVNIVVQDLSATDSAGKECVIPVT